MKSVAEAVKNATLDDLVEVGCSQQAGDNFDNDVVLNETNMGFHRQIAIASGNTVLLSCSTCCATSSRRAAPHTRHFRLARSGPPRASCHPRVIENRDERSASSACGSISRVSPTPSIGGIRTTIPVS